MELRPWLGSRRAADVLALDDLPQCSNRDVWRNGVLHQAIGCTMLVSLDNGNLHPQRQILIPLPSQGPSHTAPFLSRLRLGDAPATGAAGGRPWPSIGVPSQWMACAATAAAGDARETASADWDSKSGAA